MRHVKINGKPISQFGYHRDLNKRNIGISYRTNEIKEFLTGQLQGGMLNFKNAWGVLYNKYLPGNLKKNFLIR